MFEEADVLGPAWVELWTKAAHAFLKQRVASLPLSTVYSLGQFKQTDGVFHHFQSALGLLNPEPDCAFDFTEECVLPTPAKAKTPHGFVFFNVSMLNPSQKVWVRGAPRPKADHSPVAVSVLDVLDIDGGAKTVEIAVESADGKGQEPHFMSPSGLDRKELLTWYWWTCSETKCKVIGLPSELRAESEDALQCLIRVRALPGSDAHYTTDSNVAVDVVLNKVLVELWHLGYVELEEADNLCHWKLSAMSMDRLRLSHFATTPRSIFGDAEFVAQCEDWLVKESENLNLEKYHLLLMLETWGFTCKILLPPMTKDSVKAFDGSELLWWVQEPASLMRSYMLAVAKRHKKLIDVAVPAFKSSSFYNCIADGKPPPAKKVKEPSFIVAGEAALDLASEPAKPKAKRRRRARPMPKVVLSTDEAPKEVEMTSDSSSSSSSEERPPVVIAPRSASCSNSSSRSFSSSSSSSSSSSLATKEFHRSEIDAKKWKGFGIWYIHDNSVWTGWEFRCINKKHINCKRQARFDPSKLENMELAERRIKW